MASISFGAGLHDTDTLRQGTCDCSNDHDQIEELHADTAWLFGLTAVNATDKAHHRILRPNRLGSIEDLTGALAGFRLGAAMYLWVHPDGEC